jgi:hypothetical protein
VKGTSNPVAGPEGGHHRLIGSIELWRRSRVFLIYAAFVMLAGEGINVFGAHKLDPTYLVIAIAFLLVAAGFYWRQRTHYVALGPEGLHLRSTFKVVELPYELLRQSRCQPVKDFFNTSERRALLTGSLKRLSNRPACILKVEQDHEQLLEAGRMLGRATVVDQQLVMLVDGAEGLDKALQARIRRRPPAASPKLSRRR